MTSREKFEAWMTDEQWFHGSDFEWDERRNCYAQFGIHLAYKAFLAAESASQQKLTDLAVHLANAESKCRELAAEVQAVRWACGQVYMKGYNHGHLNTVDGLEYASDTELVERGGETLAEFTDPDHCGVAADAILAEVRAQGVEMFADDLLCPDLDSTIRKFAAQLRKGVVL
ncbi:hypothetical protein MMA45_06900 [Salmonella enterica]|nr:hypothetical protein [Salmonella enterica]MCH5835079.1 hypothetical protein [Salmonella enterica]MCH5839667.1 hypothetical protein [Salmonella enterica]MCH5858791.1 hypothetical protein [Salmonella enterica]MCH5863821.1 hypothetical protein [Salmonella enterica]